MATLNQVIKTMRTNKLMSEYQLEVFEIVCQCGFATATEVFQQYKKNHPNTTKSRNDISSTLNKLNNGGIITLQDKPFVCPKTKRKLCVWQSNSTFQYDSTQPPSYSVDIVRDLQPVDVIGSAKAVPFFPETNADCEQHKQILWQTIQNCNRILRMRYVLFPSFVQKTEKMKNALLYAVNTLEKK